MRRCGICEYSDQNIESDEKTLSAEKGFQEVHSVHIPVPTQLAVAPYQDSSRLVIRKLTLRSHHRGTKIVCRGSDAGVAAPPPGRQRLRQATPRGRLALSSGLVRGR